jgi:serine/threonine protein kinase
MAMAQVQSQDVVFGERYWLTRPLAVGGMAEVFLAKFQTADGFSKDAVIKRLKPELAKDPRVLAMFRDEARVSGMLNHGNTVHAFDSGTHEGLPFMAMEYIRGEELNALCRRGIGCGEFLPLEHAIELVRQAALGMGYYHNLRDSQGQNLDLVHCDISPNNLLVGEDGYLQIIDFGIGQFRGQQYRDDKLVPGKLSYMSPEQARRRKLDHRSDIFALGIVLYEITLGQRLFRGPANEVLPRLLSCDVKAPTFVRHDYPGALESIVMRALEAEPSNRYQEAYDFADALGNYLREEQMRTGPIGVARYLDRLAVAEGGERREEFISELEEDQDEESLDFDRGLFSGFKAMAEQNPKAVESWDDLEEDESAVAEVVGIDVALVRTASKVADAPEPEPEPEPELEEESAPAVEAEPEEARSAAPAPASPEQASSSPALVLTLLLIGIGIGVGGALLFGTLS